MDGWRTDVMGCERLFCRKRKKHWRDGNTRIRIGLRLRLEVIIKSWDCPKCAIFNKFLGSKYERNIPPPMIDRMPIPNPINEGKSILTLRSSCPSTLSKHGISVEPERVRLYVYTTDQQLLTNEYDPSEGPKFIYGHHDNIITLDSKK